MDAGWIGNALGICLAMLHLYMYHYSIFIVFCLGYKTVSENEKVTYISRYRFLLTEEVMASNLNLLMVVYFD